MDIMLILLFVVGISLSLLIGYCLYRIVLEAETELKQMEREHNERMEESRKERIERNQNNLK